MHDVQQTASAQRISTVLHDFVRLWARFEGALHEELARTHGCSSKTGFGGQGDSNTNHELLYRVGTCIYPANNLTMGELSRALSVPLSTATRMVDWLVAGGCVERLLDPEDRRVVRVALTHSGRELYEITEEYIAERVQQILSCLRDEEHAALFALIHKVVAALEEAEGKTL